jgi:hypothetical protein
MEDSRGAYRVLMRIHEGKRPFGRPTRRWTCDIKEHGVIAWTGCCECANGTSGFVKRVFLDEMRDC